MTDEQREERAREHVEEAIKLLAHDTSTLDPMMREMVQASLDDPDVDLGMVDSYFVQLAISRLALALAHRFDTPPFLVLGGIAGTMMEAQIEMERTHEIMSQFGISLN
jgi:hypothetical protein